MTIAGKVEKDFGAKANPADVRLDGESLDHPDGLLLLVHKPLGLVCSHDEREGPNVYSVLPARWRERNPQVTSIGRLDKDTSGLILLTDQSELIHRLTSPKHKVPKVYRATLATDLPARLAELFAAGTLVLTGEKEACAPATLNVLGPREAELHAHRGQVPPGAPDGVREPGLRSGHAPPHAVRPSRPRRPRRGPVAGAAAGGISS